MNNNKHILTGQIAGPSTLFRTTAPIAVIVITAVVVAVMVVTKRKPEPKARGERAALVKLMTLTSGEAQVVLQTTGTITPNREITLMPQVSGEIIWTDPRFLPGGRFNKGEIIVKIDPADYETKLAASRAAVAKAEAEFKTEQGLQDIAKHEWEALQDMKRDKGFSELEEELALRKPNLLLAESNLKSAQAQLQEAELNMSRTEIRAPFNAMIRSRNINLGSQVSPQTQLAGLVETDSIWVMTTLPVSDLKWIKAADNFGNKGSRAIISAVPGVDLGAQWEGHVLRIMPDLEKAGKQAQLIVEIPEPNKPVTGKGVLLLGSYVRVTIDGARVPDVFKIPSSALHGGSRVWLMTNENRLEVRAVTACWQGKDEVFISNGLKTGEQLVVSALGTPIQGMLLSRPGAKITKGDGQGKHP